MVITNNIWIGGIVAIAVILLGSFISLSFPGGNSDFLMVSFLLYWLYALGVRIFVKYTHYTLQAGPIARFMVH